MSRSEQSAVHEICQAFLQESVPEYIRDTAYYILSEGGVQKINIQEGETWEVQGVIQGEDLQVYTPSLNLTITDRSVRHQCNCSDAFTGICRHVAALALRLVEELRKEQGHAENLSSPNTDWRQSFRNFFSTDMEPEPGRHYLIFRFTPEQGRLLVSFFRGRQNKSGLSSVHNEVTLEQLINNPEWCEFSPQLPRVARQIGQHLDYYGHRIEIPEGLTSWFFWSVRKEYYLLWKDTDKPCRIESTPFALKLKPNLDEAGFSFDVLLKREGRPPLPIKSQADGSSNTEDEVAPVTFHGQMPLWVCYDHAFYPVQTGLYPSLVRSLIYERPVVPHDEISEFLDRVWTRLPSSELYQPEQFLKLMEPVFQPASYNPKLFLDEEGSLLTLEVDNIYETKHGEFTLNGPNPDFQTGSYTYEGQTYLVRRHQEEEAQLMAELAGMDFQARSSKLWFLEPEEAITFLLDHYPDLVERYRVYGERALSRYKMRTATPVIMAQVSSDEKKKWFSLDISVDYEGQSLPLDKIWKAWSRGKRYVQLKDGSYTSLPEAWLEKLAHKLTALGLDPTKPPQQKFKQFEAPVL
ncbi:MAG: SNF2 helicase associated domain-containing protein, partial [Desulfovibrionaceae bacterium]|nr:SNF2 helicase associated domain-containing protein [Desulfovibrionaceae bacterium]